MKTKALLFFSIVILLKSLQPVFSQNASQKISGVQLPFYLKELQQPTPPEQMKYTEPKLYEHLLKRRAMLTGMLQKEVHDKKLPESALDVLKPADPVSYNNSAENTSADKTEGSSFHLVKDINYATNSNPSNNLRGFRNTYAVLKKSIYYAADDGIHGTELWRSDGTEAGTYMVKDINDGGSSSDPSYITEFQGKIYFRAYTPATGYEMYQSDGTADSTILFKDIVSGGASGYPGQFTIVKSKLFFVVYGTQIWKTDGTPAGTVMVEDLGNDYWFVSDITELTAVKNILFFSVDFVDNGEEYENHYRELWRSDGTVEGTFGLSYKGDSEPANLTSFQDHLFFSAYSSNSSGKTLWISDGTIVGTYEVVNPNGVTINSYFGWSYSNNYAQTIPMPIANNCLYFAGSTPKTGNELYKYDIIKGIVLVKDITPGTAGSNLSTESLRSMNNNIYFSLFDTTNKNFSLWKSGGIPINTKIVKSLPGNINPYSFYVSDSLLYFGINASKVNEPWVSDGTDSGTMLLKDINPLGSSGSGYFTACNGKVYFSAYSDNNGQELWITNGNRHSTKLVKDINTSATGSSVADGGAALNSTTLIFSAYTPQYGYELWKTDGTDAGTVLVKDIDSGEYSSYPYLRYINNGKAYFTAYDVLTNAETIYVTDGTASGTKKIAFADNELYILGAADNGMVFYSTIDDCCGPPDYIALWRTDSTGVSVYLDDLYYGPIFYVIKNMCYYPNYTGQYGGEPYISDGTHSGTHILADINPGGANSNPSPFIPFNNKVLFQTDIGLYETDGTAGGTFQLSKLIPEFYYGTAAFQGKLYF